MKYTEITFSIEPRDPYCDVLIFELGDKCGCDSFEETDNGVKAYVQSNVFDENLIIECVENLKDIYGELNCGFTITDLPDKDYNETWERGREPVLVDDFCLVRSPEHAKTDSVEYDIVIDTHMAFGTAHHATTYLMISALRNINVEGKYVLDMGCGTAVLAILAAKKGAARVYAVDVDEWAYKSAKENVVHNAVNVDVVLGDASTLKDNVCFDVVLANINRNILMNDMDRYVSVMNNGGVLIMSGFYEDDMSMLRNKAEQLGMEYSRSSSRDEWFEIEMIKR